jgi:rubrerythrin
MSDITGAPEVESLADLFAVAYQIEADAADRYELLAAQMETHNNPELVAVFRDLARAEAIHRDEIRRLAGDVDVVSRARKLARWAKGESPEEVDIGRVHYMMTPWHALDLALAAEKRALAFFTSIVETATDPRIKQMAEAFAQEETEHVNLVYRLTQKYLLPAHAWSDDLDPAIAQG